MNMRYFINLVEDVWHGTKHDFDQFSIAHIGTGEGNFTFGWGLYFTDKKEIAEWYRDRLNDNPRGVVVQVTPPKCVQADWGSTPIEFEGEYTDYGLKEMIVNVIDTLSPYHKDVDFASNGNAGRTNYVYHLRGISQSLFEKIFLVKNGDMNRIASPFIEQGPKVWAKECYDEQTDPREDTPEDLAKIRDMINAALVAVSSIQYVKRKGIVYKVNIPDESKYLLWDVEYRNQSESVRNGLIAAEKELFGGDHSWFGDDNLQNLSGKRVYNSIVEMLMDEGYDNNEWTYEEAKRKYYNESKKKTSLMLLKHGIFGIKYLDNTSRTASKTNPHYNYVLFTDQNVNVIHKEKN